MDLIRKILKKFTKKFGNKIINRQYFHRRTGLKTTEANKSLKTDANAISRTTNEQKDKA